MHQPKWHLMWHHEMTEIWGSRLLFLLSSLGASEGWGLRQQERLLGDEGMWTVMSERAAISMTAAWLSIAAAVTYAAHRADLHQA